MVPKKWETISRQLVQTTGQLAFESSALHLISKANGKMIPQLNLGNTEVPFSSCDLGPSLRCLLFEIKQLILRCLLFEIKQLILPFSSWALGPPLRCLLVALTISSFLLAWTFLIPSIHVSIALWMFEWSESLRSFSIFCINVNTCGDKQPIINQSINRIN